MKSNEAMQGLVRIKETYEREARQSRENARLRAQVGRLQAYARYWKQEPDALADEYGIFYFDVPELEPGDLDPLPGEE